ncbi:MAG: acyl-CoA desaturase [Chitinophagales bacterium]
MSTTTKQPMLKFSKDQSNDFFVVLRKRVNTYFKENHISKTGNTNMVAKTIFMISLYFVPYAFLLSGLITNPWIMILMWLIMGMGMSGIGLSIMHDANHGSYSKNKHVNKVLSYILELMGGSSRNWRIQHNKLHHTYTNVEGMDVDIKERGILRFSPHQKRRKVHRLQFIYAWLLYGIMSLYWVTAKDFLQMVSFKKQGHIAGKEYRKLVAEIILGKIFYYAYALVLPMVLLPFSPWLVFLGFFAMHFVAGFVLTCIFQTAHVMTSTEYPLPDENGEFENNWAIHQLKTTTNYAPKSTFFSWFVGGLNYQVEHHLFPNICHVHYKKISKIVQQTANEYNVPYNFKKSFASAMWEHTKMLYILGKSDLMYVKS